MSPAQYHMSEVRKNSNYAGVVSYISVVEDLTPGVTAPSKTGNKNELTLSSTNHLSSVMSVQLYMKTMTNANDSVDCTYLIFKEHVHLNKYSGFNTSYS